MIRRVERKTSEGYETCKMSELQTGDIFRMFEPTGEPVIWDCRKY